MSYKLKVLLLLLLPFGLAAQQNVKFTSGNFKGNSQGLKFAQKKITEGDNHIKAGEYELAIACYLKADSVNPNNADLNSKLGVCYLNSNYYKSRCLNYFRHAYNLDHNISKRMPYYLGRGYHLNGVWDSALTEYQLFMKQANPKEKKEAAKYMEECNNGKELVQHPVKADLQNLGAGINGTYPDYSPFITADENEIVFTSKRSTNMGGFIDPNSGEYLEDIYISHFKDGKWSEAENLGAPINTNDNDATAYLTPDGQQLFLYRYVNGGDIFVSNYSSQGWSDPVALSNKINSPYHESSVCLSPNGKTLYFVSDKPGGKGGRDIYKSYLQPDNSWGEAINMGDTINTKYDEESVYIHPDGKTLYFCSKGHNTMGGYDIFKSTLENGQWGVPQNMGYPINTPDDDVFFIVSASGKHGYYASAKEGGFGGLDIYRVDMEAFKTKLIVIKGVIGDSITRAPLMANIKLINKTSNTTTPSVSNATTGAYVLSLPSGSDYEIDVHSDGYPDYSFSLSIADTTTYQEITKNIYLLKPGSVAITQKDTVKPVVASGNDTCTLDKATVLSRFEGFTKDTNALMTMISKMTGDVCLKNMKFTVQIGAYHFPRNFKYKKVEIKPVAINDFPDGITRFTMGSFINYKEAMGLRDAAIKVGVKDAWITGLYHGKRVLLDQMLHPH